MNMPIKAVTRLTLDLSLSEIQKSVTVTQGDVSRQLEITVTDGGRPYPLQKNWTAVLSAIKPDGAVLYNGCVVDRGRILYDFASGEEIATCAGAYTAKIVIYDETGGTVATPKLWINVLRKATRDVASQDQFTAARELVRRIARCEGDLETLSEEVAKGGPFAPTVGKVVIRADEWAEHDDNPVEARIRIPNITPNTVALLVPADDATREAATAAALTTMLDTVEEDTDTVCIARGTSAPERDMTFLCFVFRGRAVDTAGEAGTLAFAPSVSFVGISTGSGGGGGGGGGGNYVTFRVFNRTGWLAKTLRLGDTCSVRLTWSSLEGGMETGDGMVELSVNGVRRSIRGVSQGDLQLELSPYLTLGTNAVEVTITDVYGSSRTVKYTVTTVSIGLTSYFDDAVAYGGDIPFSYVPSGELEKTVYLLLDGEEIGRETVTASLREQPFTIPAQSHGSHALEVYFTAEIEGQTVESNHLYYDLICTEAGRTEPIIGCAHRTGSVEQHALVPIRYVVYTPGALESDVTLADGDTAVSELRVDRTRQTWAYSALVPGEHRLTITCGETVKLIPFTVTESDIRVSAETSNLELYLTSLGRSNQEKEPLVWRYGDVEAVMTGFNLKSDGWQADDGGHTVLRVAGDARVEIPYPLFGRNFTDTGKTVEIELATHHVSDYDAVVLSCESGGRGLEITAQKAALRSEQSEISTRFKEDEHIRVAFCVEKRAANRLLSVYVNGIMSGALQYPADDSFAQAEPVGITIGSSACTTDIYCIRVYSNDLSRHQLLDNWIADTRDAATMAERYRRNEIYDAYGGIDLNLLPPTLPYLVVNAASYADLPQYKGDVKTVDGRYVDPLHEERSFTFEGAELNVQGTSSQFYARKNYLLDLKRGLTVRGEHRDTYALREGSMPVSVFCFKADVASSEGANNVELVRLYDDTCPVKTPPQLADARVRQGIEGYPCLMFYFDGRSHRFVGKYNFNNDKSTSEVFGFEAGDESWEILQNNTLLAVFKDDDFSGDAWQATFEGRYPAKGKDTARLSAFVRWVRSTDTTAAGLTAAERAARLETFRSELSDWCNVDAMLYNYLFTELFLMVDTRAKNAFPTRYDEDGKWLILPYDYDTALGIDNSGELKFGYHLEDTDMLGTQGVFNGHESVLYVNIRKAFGDELKAMYQTLRRNDTFSYPEIERRFEEHQGVWGEAVFNEDAHFKYIEPLISDGNSTYLKMLQGSKAEQRKWWLYNRFRYMDAKYEAADSLEDYILLRTYGVADLTLTPYADIYAAAKFDSVTVKTRALRGASYVLRNPLDKANDTVVGIYSASCYADLGDLSPLKVGTADFSKGTHLRRLKVGDGAAGYKNPNLTELTVGNLTLLSELDIRGCTGLSTSVDLSGCTGIEHVLCEGSSVTAVKLPVGGRLKTLHLPATVTALTIRNHASLSDFSMPSYSQLTTLRLEGVGSSAIDVPAMLAAMPAGSRVRLLDVDMETDTDTLLALYDKLDSFRGLDEQGGDTDRAVITGRVTVERITQTELSELTARYPDVSIRYTHLCHAVTFQSNGTRLSHQRLLPGETVLLPADPTKESSVRYDYWFDGWSTDGETVIAVPTVMGDASVTYVAVFAKAERSYWVRFYHGDTLLQESYVGYGELPVYAGADLSYIEGDRKYTFIGWSPELLPVTGTATYEAQFMQARTLNAHTWREISVISEAGTAASYFEVGDTKAVTVVGKIGDVSLDVTYYAYILGFDHNESLEGRGIHFGTFKSAEVGGTDLCLMDFRICTDGLNNYGGWAGCDLRYGILGSTDVPPSGYGSNVNSSRVGYDATASCATTPVPGTLMAALPAELRAVMKPMIKYTDNVGGGNTSSASVTASVDYLPLLAEAELSSRRYLANESEQTKQQRYAYFDEGNSIKKYAHNAPATGARWWTRSPDSSTTSGFAQVTASGGVVMGNITYGYGIAPIFKV